MSTKIKFILIAIMLASGIGLAFTVSNNRIVEKEYVSIVPIKKDSVASVAAFKQVYKVLMSPRCVNCHPKGDIPLQGDNSVIHSMQPKRGKDGKGVYAMKCANCHQSSNSPGLHTPPGNPDWHLPPADMKMVFEGKTAHELAKQLVNPKLNGHKDLQKLIAHADDGLVKAGWNMGKGRTVPPLTHAQFKKAWITWLQTGAYAPAK
ncbi:hypothetical protein [Flavobacterium salmonis]|uniref:Cytochrome c domain-containing protein n=1 Tax=Flavobacterium salmonis TaxID=2654844 RepID=A0A6V6Z4Z0_9FLAO|nr:hypothetical protein [Flavobacterium salmonis]CAD0006715.1 hypothetical protein FLAT13_03446 [Flavobacterium salmonis]